MGPKDEQRSREQQRPLSLAAVFYPPQQGGEGRELREAFQEPCPVFFRRARCRGISRVGNRVLPISPSSRAQGDPVGPRLAQGQLCFRAEILYGRLQVPIPEVPDAEFVNDDELCLTCHEAYTKTFPENVHCGDSCESCHGPASRHLETRGKEPGLILSFKTLGAAERSELCLKCHEENGCSPGAQWRYSVHAHKGVTCVDCHRGHYNVPLGTPATTEPGESAYGPGGVPIELTSYQGAVASLAGSSDNLGASAPGPTASTARPATRPTGRSARARGRISACSATATAGRRWRSTRPRTTWRAWPARTATIRTRPPRCRDW